MIICLRNPQYVVNIYTVKEPTVEEEGLKEATCDNCGEKQSEIIPKLEPDATEIDVDVTHKEINVSGVIIATVSISAAVVVIGIVICVIVLSKKKK